MLWTTYKIACVLVVAAVGPALTGCGSPANERDGILVFAAASLTDVLHEIGELYEEDTGRVVSFSYSGSQTLAQQIASGAPADLFISAGRFPLDYLIDQGAVGPDVEPLLANSLVVITRAGEDGITSVAELATDRVERVAVADPDLAPAGRYAEEALTHLGLWRDIQDKLVYGNDVRVTMTYVESGNADVGLVYETDARNARKLEVRRIVPRDSYSPIAYLAAVVERSEKKRSAGEFTSFLKGDSAAALFRKHGFEPLGQ